LAGNYFTGTGRRKTSIARVKICKGNGKIEINGRTLEDYFPRKILQMIIKQPLAVTDTDGKIDIIVNILGGGPSSQAGAVRHGIARALIRLDASNRPSLKRNGFLTRDPRMVERKKYGKHGARRSTQFSKR